MQLPSLSSDEVFREKESPFLIVLRARELSTQSQAHHGPLFCGQPGGPDAAVLQVLLEALGTEVSLVHLRVEVLTVEPCLNLWRFDLAFPLM